ncbi:hypothetical protein CHS0354_028794, partial [Potamilus streckersoni]
MIDTKFIATSTISASLCRAIENYVLGLIGGETCSSVGDHGSTVSLVTCSSVDDHEERYFEAKRSLLIDIKTFHEELGNLQRNGKRIVKKLEGNH